MPPECPLPPQDSEGMFFIAEGKVEVLSTNGLVLTTLGDHSFFGEMSLINPEAGAVASVRAKGFCQGYFLSRSCYQKLIRTHPTFERYIETIAKMRLRRQSASGAALMADHKKARPSGAKAGPTLEAERTALQQNIAELGSPERSVQLSDAPRPDLGGTSTFLGRGDYPGALRGPLVA
jgi:signal-transduction protein with cAMP-binding, CBS, and nucleotidyltransferase domain